MIEMISPALILFQQNFMTTTYSKQKRNESTSSYINSTFAYTCINSISQCSSSPDGRVPPGANVVQDVDHVGTAGLLRRDPHHRVHVVCTECLLQAQGSC